MISRNALANMTSALKKFNGVRLICTPKAIMATPTKALAKDVEGSKEEEPMKIKWQ